MHAEAFGARLSNPLERIGKSFEHISFSQVGNSWSELVELCKRIRAWSCFLRPHVMHGNGLVDSKYRARMWDCVLQSARQGTVAVTVQSCRNVHLKISF